ncbi:MAG: hypothetical protein IJU07_05545 [Synergistaceae bacterium]|nr:hypothetical protein [Synergistaceae bacterium]
MQKKFFAALPALALITALFTGRAAAVVTINGKPLDQIDDIVRETTGSHVEEKLSFLKFMNYKNGTYQFWGVWGNVDGSGNVTLNQSSNHDTGHRAGRTNTGVYPVAAKKRTPDGKLPVMFPASQTKDGKHTIFINSVKISGDPVKHWISHEDYRYRTIYEHSNEYMYINDSTSGIFPNSREDDEIFALSFFVAKGNKRPGYSQTYESYIALINLYKLTWKIHRIGNMNGSFPSIRLTAGDFDNDGRENELAIIRDGSGADYYMQVFRVDSSLNIGSAIFAKSLGRRENTEADNFDGCDITAGDFNGDGNTELAVVYANKLDTDGYPTVSIFSWNGSTFTEHKNDNNDDSVRLGSNNFFRSSYVPHFGIIAEAGDIDDNGSDELVFLTASYGHNEGNIVISLWGTDSSLNPSKKYIRKTSQKIAGYGGVSGVDMAECSYLPRSVSLALVPAGQKLSTGGSVRWIFVSKTQGGDSVKSSSDYRTGDQTFYSKPQFTDNSLTGIDDLTLFNEGGAGYAMQLVPGDFYCETFELGEPEHIVVRQHKNYSVILKAVPYHIDCIQAPWMDSMPANPYNFSYLGRSVKYSNTSEKGDERLVTAKTQNAVEGGLNFTYNVNAGAKVPGIIEAGGKAGFSLAAAAGFTKVNETSDREISKVSLTDTISTATADVLSYTIADYHIWRYPIAKQFEAVVSQDFEGDEFLEEGNTELSGNYFFTYTLCDTPGQSDCDSTNPAQYDDYNPIYEEGNLFSYPNSVTYGMEDFQKELSGYKEFTLGSSTEEVYSFTNGGSSSDKDATSWRASVTGDIHADVNASATVKILKAGAGWSAKLYGKYAHDAANSVTSTKTWSTNEKVNISAQSGAILTAKEDVDYSTCSQVFVDASGVLTTPFGVKLSNTAWLWSRNSKELRQSPYVISSDPALVLPGRYVYRKEQNPSSGIINNVWRFTDNEASATKIRGMKFYDTVTKEYVDGVLEKGWTYTISVPIYNASFVDVPGGGVVVEYGYRNEDGTGKTQIGRQTIPLKGWTNDGEIEKGGTNKATIVFDWTPYISDGDYEFYIELDPDNAISEVHERWTKSSRAGNNNGYRPFSVVSTEGVNSGELSASTVSSAEEGDTVTSGDFTLRFWDNDVESGDAMTASELRVYVLRRNNDVNVRGRVSYNGSTVITNANVSVYCNPISNGASRIISSRRIPAIRPGKVREFYFIMSPEKLSEGTFGVSLSSSEGGFTLNGGSGKVDPAPETVTGVSSSSGGCNSSSAASALVMLAAVLALRRSKAKP